MSASFQKRISQALKDSLKDFEDGLRAQGGHDAGTIKNVYMRGAKTFVEFLTTGVVVKRDQRTKRLN